jgi:cellulose synthase/poly-beta-1,6-N-acetylglucosamine synthase-like glycosyltransferase
MIALTVTTKREAKFDWLTNYQEEPPSGWSSWTPKFEIYLNEPNLGVVRAYHKLWEQYREEDILVYIHDDVTIHETGWMERVRKAFENPKVAIVGFGGATGMGSRDIYKKPYNIMQLVRLGYCSNQTDWPQHGMREEGERGVAVIDGFFMALRGTFLKEVGGWDWIHSNFHCYDTAMCLEAYRRNWEVRMVGVSCTHEGGGTSTKEEYAEWCVEHGTTMENEHSIPHLWLYNEFRDVLPIRLEDL